MFDFYIYRINFYIYSRIFYIEKHVQQTTAQPQVKEQVKEQGQEPNVKPVISTTPVADKIDTLFTSYKVNKTHLVQDGETLESIAELYQVTPAQIKACMSGGRTMKNRPR